MSAHCPIRLVMRHGICVNQFKSGESCLRSLCFGNGGGVSNMRAKRGRYTEQLFVEEHDGRPIGPSGAGALRMHGLNGSFQLKSAGAALFERFAEMEFRFFYQRE